MRDQRQVVVVVVGFALIGASLMGARAADAQQSPTPISPAPAAAPVIAFENSDALTLGANQSSATVRIENLSASRVTVRLTIASSAATPPLALHCPSAAGASQCSVDIEAGSEQAVTIDRTASPSNDTLAKLIATVVGTPSIALSVTAKSDTPVTTPVALPNAMTLNVETGDPAVKELRTAAPATSAAAPMSVATPASVAKTATSKTSDTGGAVASPIPARVLVGYVSGDDNVLHPLFSNGSQLDVEPIESPGAYKGSVDLAPDEDKAGAIDITVDVHRSPWFAVLLLAIGWGVATALAIATGHVLPALEDRQLGDSLAAKANDAYGTARDAIGSAYSDADAALGTAIIANLDWNRSLDRLDIACHVAALQDADFLKTVADDGAVTTARSDVVTYVSAMQGAAQLCEMRSAIIGIVRQTGHAATPIVVTRVVDEVLLDRSTAVATLATNTSYARTVATQWVGDMRRARKLKATWANEQAKAAAAEALIAAILASSNTRTDPAVTTASATLEQLLWRNLMPPPTQAQATSPGVLSASPPFPVGVGLGLAKGTSVTAVLRRMGRWLGRWLVERIQRGGLRTIVYVVTFILSMLVGMSTTYFSTAAWGVPKDIVLALTWSFGITATLSIARFAGSGIAKLIGGTSG